MSLGTRVRSAFLVLLAAGLIVTLAKNWNTLDQQETQGLPNAGAERTHDDRRQHTIKLRVTYRPARQIYITWGIGSEGDREARFKNDRAEWEKTRTKVPDGTLVNVGVDNFDQGGYLNCEILQDGAVVRHFNNEHTTHRDSCDLYFTVGGH